MERLTDVAELMAPFFRGIKAPKDFRLGVELEYLLVRVADLTMVPYEHTPGIRDVFVQLIQLHGWSPIYEQAQIIGLARGQERVTLEPGGVIEYSSSLLGTVWEVEQAIAQFLAALHTVVKPMELGLLPLGLHPFAAPDDVALVPKQRYHIIHEYMPQVGMMGRHMMKLTCAAQITIDFSSEADAIRKMQLAARLTPFLVALSANSAVCEGTYTGLASTRAQTWLTTDPARTGFPPCVFQPRASFMDYVEWALDVPIYFVERDDIKMVVGHPSFREFMEEGVLLPGQTQRTYATMADWQLHLGTVFPWVRLCDYLELRACDVNTPDIVVGLLALVKGLFYSNTALKAVEEIVGDYDRATVEGLLHEAVFYGMAAEIHGTSFYDMLGALVDIARNSLCDQGLHEYVFLKPFETIALKSRVDDLMLLSSLHIEPYVRSKILT